MLVLWEAGGKNLRETRQDQNSPLAACSTSQDLVSGSRPPPATPAPEQISQVEALDRLEALLLTIRLLATDRCFSVDELAKLKTLLGFYWALGWRGSFMLEPRLVIMERIPSIALPMVHTELNRIVQTQACAERKCYPLSSTISQTTMSESDSTSDVGGNTFAITPSLFARMFCRRRSLSFNASPGKYICVIMRLIFPVTSKCR